MTRDIDPATKSASEGEIVRPFNLVYIDMETVPVRAASTPFNLPYLGDNFLGVGEFGSVGQVEETGENKAYNLELSLAGVDPSLIQQTLAENYQGRECIVYAGFLDEDLQIVGAPIIVFLGLVQNMKVRAGSDATIIVEAVNEVALWETGAGFRYNNQAQQSRYPGDRGLEFMEQIREKEILWPDRS